MLFQVGKLLAGLFLVLMAFTSDWEGSGITGQPLIWLVIILCLLSIYCFISGVRMFIQKMDEFLNYGNWLGWLI